MHKGCKEIKGSRLRGGYTAHQCPSLTPENLWQEGDPVYRNGNTLSAFFPLLLEKIAFENNTKRQTGTAMANLEQL